VFKSRSSLGAEICEIRLKEGEEDLIKENRDEAYPFKMFHQKNDIGELVLRAAR